MSTAQLSQLLPLPEEELRQVLEYASTLSKADAASHLCNLLGDSPLAVAFISDFNSRREPADIPTLPTPATADVIEPVPKWKKEPKKKKSAIHTPQPRKVDEYAGLAGKAYKKDSDLEYIPQKAGSPSHAPPQPEPKDPAQPLPQSARKPNMTTAGGYLISDVQKKGKPAAATRSTPVSRSSTPKPTASPGGVTKVAISGGLPMAGQSTALADLDLAIRALEITTNPTLDNAKARRCNCVATRHPLQAAAPNCLSCGKVVCLREGLGPCTFCGTPVLGSADIQAMIRELKDERGREKMLANAAAHKKTDARTPTRSYDDNSGNDYNNKNPSLAEAAARAREHRDKLLDFQANNAKRTTVHDEAADFDVSGAVSGVGSLWATPEERARELKRQQRVMREMEWNARPEYEKRQQIVSIDLAGRRVKRTIGSVQRPATPEGDDDDEEEEVEVDRGGSIGGAFSANPLLGAALRPVFDVKGKGAEGEGRGRRKKGWRRVQDDLDNEDVILDGGVFGHATGDEPGCG